MTLFEIIWFLTYFSVVKSCFPLLLLFLLSSIGKAQDLLPDENFLVINRQLLYNAAYSKNFNSTYSGSFRYSGYLGNKAVLKKYYLETNVAILDTQRLHLSLSIFHDEEGPYITFNNIKWGFSYQIIRTSRYAIYSGLMFGAMNMAFVGNGNIGGGSDWGVDADAGLYFRAQKWEGGIGISHLPNAKVQPLTTRLGFDRTYNLSLARKFILNEFWQNHWNATFRYGKEMKARLNLYGELVYAGKYAVIINVADNKVFGVGGGLQALKLYDKVLVDFNFVFNTNLLVNSAIDEYRYEIGLCIRGN